MGRPASFDRDDAIEIAMQEIWRHGYEGSSVKAISEKLGITRSSYYNSFGSREELFKAALEVYFAQSPDAVLHQDLPSEGVLELLTDTFRKICTARAADPEGRGCLAINSLTELSGTYEELGQLLKDAVLQSASRIKQLLQLAVEYGELPANTDVHAMSLALQNLMIGLNVFAKVKSDENELWLATKITLQGLGITPKDDHANV